MHRRFPVRSRESFLEIEGFTGDGKITISNGVVHKLFGFLMAYAPLKTSSMRQNNSLTKLHQYLGGGGKRQMFLPGLLKGLPGLIGWAELIEKLGRERRFLLGLKHKKTKRQ
jgi:hypothetical protein